MKIKDILFASFTASVLMIGNTSCSDSFLGEKMYSSYGTDVADVNAKILGIHYKVGCILGYSSNQGYPGIWQVGTDVGAPGDTQGVENPFYRYAELNSENAGVSYLWTMLYDIINCSNQIITAEEENGDKALVAEAKFFRAWAYNQLVTGWGDVPLVIESATTPRTDYVREAVTEIDKVIEEDLVYAVENLPEVTALAKESRISKDAARQLAGETYLRIGMRDNSYFRFFSV